ncbi:hypothetical protein ACIQNK_36350 [Streptomyces sp. NPDC091273]|uniref:hypothetical protein n=1 Tax=Streptomyces sp. NPDC091273 TaxID=3365982 RepID=UPI0038025AE7
MSSLPLTFVVDEAADVLTRNPQALALMTGLLLTGRRTGVEHVVPPRRRPRPRLPGTAGLAALATPHPQGLADHARAAGAQLRAPAPRAAHSPTPLPAHYQGPGGGPMMMNSQTHVVIVGYVDAIPAPGTGWGTACLDLIHSPADADRIAPDTPDTVYACTTGDPRIADLLLREIQPGDLLRVTGTIVQPDAPGAPARLTVDALEILDAAPAPVLHGLVLECWSDYVSVFDADRDTVPVFTAARAWVGMSASADEILDLIDAYEEGRRTR